ncbi:Translin [Dunaliella salina]|uniref:Translin n=1 Tax=Dunaliella salina TaxID=3046 RepID=A0ABQ7GK47_DUNSA|nr:Translin [Dunaliella salina]|eukprot:KAF5834948.1 Translin [Dunaliella salina]
MLDTTDFAQVRNAVELYDDRRESVIKRCRDSQKLAKQAIYSLHRGDSARAEAQLKDVEMIANELLPMITESPFLRMGSYSASMEEYGEAMAFLLFLKEGRLVQKSELPLCDTEECLDLRMMMSFWRPVPFLLIGNIITIHTCKTPTGDAIMGEFLQFNLRNSGLRKKFDSLKYTLKKLENTLYELSLTENLGMKTLEKEEEPEAEPGQGPDAEIE